MENQKFVALTQEELLNTTGGYVVHDRDLGVGGTGGTGGTGWMGGYEVWRRFFGGR